MNIETNTWKEFRLGDLFTQMYKAEAHIKAEYDFYSTPFENSIRFISRTEENNGCDCYILNRDLTGIEDGMAIVIGDTTATCSYQEDPFVCGDHMVICRADWINLYSALFIITLLKQEKYKYSYGRAFKMQLISDTILKLPATPERKPDWDYMESFIKSLNHKPLATANQGGCASPTLGVESWKEFVYTDIFQLKGGFYNKKPEHSVNGKIPFLASTESNNVVTEYYSLEDIKQWDKVGNEDWTLDKKLYDGNCITVTVNGSVCNAYYQSDVFTCSHDITALYLKGYILNRYIAVFLCTVIMKEKYRWSYGRKPHDIKKFGKSIIKLPVNREGKPDWPFMESYIKSLPYGDRI